MTRIIARLKPYKWVVRWTVFLLVLAQLFIAASYILRPITEAREIHMGFYEIDYELDVVCIGASSTYCYWAPLTAWEEYGIASYNFANNLTVMEGMLTLLKETLLYQSPELIVVDLRRFYNETETRTEVHIRHLTDNMRYSLNRTQLLLELVPDRLTEGQEDTLFYYLFDIAKYHNNWKDLSAENFGAYTNAVYNYEKGFYTYDTVDPTLNDFTDYSYNASTTAPNDYTLSVFEEFLTYASTVDAEFLFVVTPYEETEAAREVYNYYETLILESGMDYLNTNDFREEMNIVNTSENFFDKGHVNIFGAEKYTRFLGEYITTNYDISDRSEDASYDFWNEEYLIWAQDVADLKEYVLNILNTSTE